MRRDPAGRDRVAHFGDSPPVAAHEREPQVGMTRCDARERGEERRDSFARFQRRRAERDVRRRHAMCGEPREVVDLVAFRREPVVVDTMRGDGDRTVRRRDRARIASRCTRSRRRSRLRGGRSYGSSGGRTALSCARATRGDRRTSGRAPSRRPGHRGATASCSAGRARRPARPSRPVSARPPAPRRCGGHGSRARPDGSPRRARAWTTAPRRRGASPDAARRPSARRGRSRARTI